MLTPKQLIIVQKSLIEYGRVIHFKIGIELIQEERELKVVSSKNKVIIQDDRILEVNGEKVNTVKKLAKVLSKTEQQDLRDYKKNLHLLIRRGTSVKSVSITISDRDLNESFVHGCF